MAIANNLLRDVFISVASSSASLKRDSSIEIAESCLSVLSLTILLYVGQPCSGLIITQHLGCVNTNIQRDRERHNGFLFSRFTFHVSYLLYPNDPTCSVSTQLVSKRHNRQTAPSSIRGSRWSLCLPAFDAFFYLQLETGTLFAIRLS